MTRLLRAELRKVFSTKLWWGMLLGAVGLAALGTIGQIASAGSGSQPELGTREAQQAVLSAGTSSQIFILIIGIIGITTEYRHFTSRPTFLTEPRRGRVIAAKLAVFALVGLLYALAALVITVAIAVPWFSAKNTTIEWGSNDLVVILFATLVGNVIWAIVGVGIGVLVRNQIAAVIGAVAYLFVVENLISIIPGVKVIYKYLPGASAQAIADIGHYHHSLLHSLPGALVFLAWGLAFAAAGWWFTVQRDVA